MLLKDLEKDTELSTIKVIIPDEYKKEMELSGIPTNKVYIVSNWNKGIWVKTDLNKSRIYPLCISPFLALEFEIA
jgi:hypothetical protein